MKPNKPKSFSVYVEPPKKKDEIYYEKPQKVIRARYLDFPRRK